MISSVSSVSFRGETDKKDVNALINDPGKFSNAAPAAPQGLESDKVDFSNSEKKEKSNTGAIIGGTLAALALAWIGLGIAVGRKGSNWKKIENPEGIMQKAKNVFYSIGESAKKAYDNTLGKWFGKAEKTADDAADAASDAGKAGGAAADGAADTAKA